MKANNKSQKLTINPFELLNVIADHPAVVVYVGPKTDVSGALLRHLADKHKPYVRGVRIDPAAIAMTTWSSVWIRVQRAQLGWPTTDEVPHGYYLFVGGHLKRYDSGVLDAERDRVFVASGLILHALAVIIAEDGDVLDATLASRLGGIARVSSAFGDEINAALQPILALFGSPRAAA